MTTASKHHAPADLLTEVIEEMSDLADRVEWHALTFKGAEESADMARLRQLPGLLRRHARDFGGDAS